MWFALYARDELLGRSQLDMEVEAGTRAGILHTTEAFHRFSPVFRDLQIARERVFNQGHRSGPASDDRHPEELSDALSSLERALCECRAIDFEIRDENGNIPKVDAVSVSPWGSPVPAGLSDAVRSAMAKDFAQVGLTSEGFGWLVTVSHGSRIVQQSSADA